MAEGKISHSVKTGMSFGLTSAVITTLGLMTGLYAGTESKAAVLGGVVMIALADGLSDALAIHVSEESENVHSHAAVWEATAVTFVAKSVVTLSFAVPVFFMELKTAVHAGIAWGGLLLIMLSFRTGGPGIKQRFKTIAEHVAIAALVVAGTYFLGQWVSARFGGL